MTDYYHRNGFITHLSKGQVTKDPSGLFVQVFANKEDAKRLSFYVCKYANRLNDPVKVTGDATYSIDHKGFVSIICLPWGQSGIVAHTGDEPAGIILVLKGKPVVLPIRKYLYACWSRSETLYVGFPDDIVFCSAKNPGEREIAGGVKFAYSSTDADAVMDYGGALNVVNTPVSGLYPILVSKDAKLSFDPKTKMTTFPKGALLRRSSRLISSWRI